MVGNIKQKQETQETKPDLNQLEKKSTSWWKLLAIAIPAYTYFFGYCSKKYYLEGLGFDNPEISGEPGPIYEFAFNSFIFINGESLNNAWPAYLKTLEEGWIQYSVMSLLAGIVVYGFGRLAFWHYRQPRKSIQNKPKEIKKKTLLISIAVTAGSFIANLAMIPAVILGMTLISIIFLPAPIIGLAMASKEITDFTCTPKSTSQIEQCATITLDETATKTGRILHADSHFLYIFTQSGAEAIPIDKIKHRLRPINKTYSKDAK